MGDVLGAIGLIEPVIKACYNSYGIYKLTSTFGTDYERAARSLEGQMARLQILADTRLDDLLRKPTNDEEFMSAVVGVLQDMRTHFEKCQFLMRRHTELPSDNDTMDSSQMTSPSTPSISISSESQERTPSTTGKSVASKLFFLRKKKSSLTPLSSHTTGQASTANVRSRSPIYSQRVSDATEESARKASERQKLSHLLSRLKWAASARKEFFSAVSELSTGNDLLERMLDIRPLSDPTFHGSFRKRKEDVGLTEFNRSWLDRLHGQLLELNPKGNEVEFSIRLAIDAKNERATHSPLVDKQFDSQSSIFALQAHFGATEQDRNQSLYLLAELPVKPEDNPTKIDKLVESFHDVDPLADPAIQMIGTYPAEITQPNMRIYQDCSATWNSTKSLSAALQDSKLRSSTLQQYHVQLALLIAYSFAILPCTYEGSDVFPQASDYVYYDQLEQPATAATADNGTVVEDGEDDEDENSSAEDLLGPWYRFHLGSRPRGLSTKALGKRRGVNPTQQNPIVALGILLSQIGMWELLPTSGGITRMRKAAIDKAPDLLRLSGIEFEDITRRCLDWKEYGEDEKRNDVQQMLQLVFLRLLGHNRTLQRLL